MNLSNKRGDTIALETVIFIVLNVAFITILLVFVVKSSSGDFIYEQVYAKQISLLIDEAKPQMTIQLNVEKGLDIAKKNNQNIDSIFNFNNNKVVVNLLGKGGYSFQHYSGYDIETKLDGSYLNIIVREKDDKK